MTALEADDDPHRTHKRKLRRHSIVSHATAIGFLLAGAPWLLYRSFMCGGEPAGTLLCQDSYTIPLIVFVLFALAIVWIALDLVRYGRDLGGDPFLQQTIQSASLRQRVWQRSVVTGHRAARAYSYLPSSHRGHLHAAIIELTLVGGAILGFLLFWEELSPLLVLAVLVLFPVLGIFLARGANRRWPRMDLLEAQDSIGA